MELSLLWNPNFQIHYRLYLSNCRTCITLSSLYCASHRCQLLFQTLFSWCLRPESSVNWTLLFYYQIFIGFLYFTALSECMLGYITYPVISPAHSVTLSTCWHCLWYGSCGPFLSGHVFGYYLITLYYVFWCWLLEVARCPPSVVWITFLRNLH